MLTRIVLTAIVCAFLFTQCNKGDEVQIPACIQQKIDSIKQTPKSTPPVQVHQWDYHGIRVYLFSARDTNSFVRVYDENCHYVCAPSGGPAGYGDSLCADFYQAAQHRSLIWKDDR
jgi:hypothetical protein